MSDKLIGLVGIAAILGIAWLLSSNRKAINLRIVGAAFGLQAAIAAFVIYFETGQAIIESMSDVVLNVMGYSKAGIEFVFGGLATDSSVASFAINVLPMIVFFSALMSVLYHIGIMQLVVKAVGGALRFVIGTRAVESLNAAANVFIGQTEAPLVVRPYLKGLTEPQMFAVMVSGVASIAGTVMLAYVQFGAELKYLLAASFMAAPGGLLMAKIIMPDEETESAEEDDKHLKLGKSPHENVILAAAVGSADGVRLAVNIGAMLVAFVALIALLNGLLGWVAGWFGIDSLTLEQILGWLFAPLMYLLSIPWSEAQAAGALFGEKIILNEFIAYSHLNEYLAGMSERTKAIVTFSLCGFANLSSIAILLGGLGSLVPEKKELDCAVRPQSRGSGFVVKPDECRAGRPAADDLTPFMPARPIIIDCDPGQDDAINLLLALAAPEALDLLGITTVAGNVPLALTERNARQMCDIAGRHDVPVYSGCDRPLKRQAADRGESTRLDRYRWHRHRRAGNAAGRRPCSRVHCRYPGIVRTACHAGAHRDR